MKPLPDFVVVGGLRTGTTTLYSLLTQVPSICMTEFKEPDFFLTDGSMSKGLDWYAGLFSDPDKVCGEVSPNYSSVDRFPGVAERIHSVSPGAKIIYVVRDPIDRLLSHYSQAWLQGDGLPDPDALKETPEGRHIIDGSRYYFQIEPYAKVFGADNIMVLEFRKMVADPHATMRRVCEFIGAPVTEEELTAITIARKNSSRNLGSVPGWWTRMSDRIKKNDSAIVRGVNRLIPRPLIRTVKGVVQATTEDRSPPDFTDDAKRAVKDALARDAQRLRDFTGKPFDHWKV